MSYDGVLTRLLRLILTTDDVMQHRQVKHTCMQQGYKQRDLTTGAGVVPPIYTRVGGIGGTERTAAVLAITRAAGVLAWRGGRVKPWFTAWMTRLCGRVVQVSRPE